MLLEQQCKTKTVSWGMLMLTRAERNCCVITLWGFVVTCDPFLVTHIVHIKILIQWTHIWFQQERLSNEISYISIQKASVCWCFHRTAIKLWDTVCPYHLPHIISLGRDEIGVWPYIPAIIRPKMLLLQQPAPVSHDHKSSLRLITDSIA